MTEENGEHYTNTNTCRFFLKNLEFNRLRDHNCSTGKYRARALEVYNINVKQKQNNFIPYIFHKFSNYDSHRFFKKHFDKKKESLHLDVIPKTDGEYLTVTYVCTGFIDGCRLLASKLDSLV